MVCSVNEYNYYDEICLQKNIYLIKTVSQIDFV